MTIEPRADFFFREAIGNAVLEYAAERGDHMTWAEMAAFPLPSGERIRLVDPGRGGIWNPSDQPATLSIITSPDGPYADRELHGGLLRYSYQSGPVGGKNLKLRQAKELGLPVLMFRKVAKGTYMPVYPVFVVDDDPEAREFTLAPDAALIGIGERTLSPVERVYAERLVKQRIHQRAFRAQVLLAYGDKCAICRLKHTDLLDAAHIIPDGQPQGDPVVPNGLSLCKIHHAAFDRRLLGIRPDLTLHVRADVLEEVDGWMLKGGIQAVHNTRLEIIPGRKADRPDADRLEVRYQEFLAG
jgi:putative restriction endonuclease